MSALFSKKNREVLLTPLGLNNPVTVQVLGICSALAVTAQLEPAIVMGLSVTIITASQTSLSPCCVTPFPTVSVSSFSWWLLLHW
mgnify:CR=1 FL=1